MKVTLVGCGCGLGYLTAEATEAIRSAELLLGSPRLLEMFPEHRAKEPATSAREIRVALDHAGCGSACVLFSGDSGFWSGARLLLPLLQQEEWKLLPGISSLQVFAARLGRPWQDWRLCSAHGTDCDPVREVCGGKPVFFLTGGRLGPAELCERICGAGLGSLKVSVGENLGTADERILTGTAEELRRGQYEALSVMLVEAAPGRTERAPGIPDEEFLREEGIPMTGQEVRSAILAKLGIRPDDVCWDIGTGTGAVAVELALHSAAVWSADRNPAAIRLAERNRRRFGAWNLRLAEGAAPEVLTQFPTPDAVFIGGSGGNMQEILTAVHRKNPQARICVSAIAVETFHTAVQNLRKLGWTVEVCQIAVSRSRSVGDLTMMLARNPVWLITGNMN